MEPEGSLLHSQVPATYPYHWASSIQSIPTVLDDTIRIWSQQAQHIHSTYKIQVTKNIYIIACWIRLGVNPLRISEQTDNNDPS
jgi:hypothetical protein